jgi:8-oxo-dGTP pyrophosphatase MutT (NUDIX family)
MSDKCDNGHVGPPLRTSSRVVVVDDSGCVLLVRILDARSTKPPLWITPGGSVEEGESLREAAARELGEETGLWIHPKRLGRPLAVSSGEWIYRDAPLFSEDWFFGLRVPRYSPQIDGYTDLEREVHGTWHWWRPDELVAPSEIVIPRGLQDVIALIVEGTDTDPEPVVLPWTAV